MVYFIGDRERIENSELIEIKEIDIAIEEIAKNSIICEDVETRGLDFHMPNPLKLIQIGTKKHQYVFDAAHPEIHKIKKILNDDNIEKIVANSIFERNMLRSIGVELNTTFDLIIAAKVLRMGRKGRYVETSTGKHFITSLAGLYYEYLGKEISKEEQSSFLVSRYKFTESQILYAAKDVELFDLYDELVRRLIKFNLLHYNYDLRLSIEELIKTNLSATVLEQKVSLYFADMVYNGIFIDYKEMLKIYDRNIVRRYNLEKRMNEFVKENFAEYNYINTEPVSITKTVQKSLFGEDVRIINNTKDKRRINWQSPAQVKELLKCEIGEYIRDKHGKETVSSKELQKPKYKKYPLTSMYIEYIKLSKLINSYGIEYKKFINQYTGKIHCSVNSVLETGRVALKNPNLAQIPADKEWRLLFRSQENTKICGADYSGQESRVMAGKANDRVFIDFFENGDGDSHSMIASKVYTAKEKRNVIVKKHSLAIELIGDEEESKDLVSKLYPIDKSEVSIIELDNKLYAFYEDTNPVKDKRKTCSLRQKGKVLNFFISFGGSQYTLSFEQGIPLKEASGLVNGFWEGFKDLKAYFDKEKAFALSKGYILVNYITKRRRWLPEWKDYRRYMNILEDAKKGLIKRFGKKEGLSKYYSSLKDKASELSFYNRQAMKLKGEIERAAMNTGIQGTAADMTKIAECLIHEKIKKAGLSPIKEIRPINHIHDETMFEVLDQYAEQAAKIIQESMERAAEILIDNLRIPASPYINKYWEH